LATDTSAEALSSAIIGKYSDSELNHGLVPGMKTEYFRREGTSWHIRDHIRSLIDFRQVNLTAPSTLPGNFDVIFCHNVFSAPESATEKTIVDRLHDVMSKNAYLFPGEDSRLTGMSGRFKKIKYGETIVYKKSQGPVEGK
jgi:chemotaxis protein methyltransferase CheR